MHHTHRTLMHRNKHATRVSEGEKRHSVPNLEEVNHHWRSAQMACLGRQNGEANAHQPEGKITASKKFSQDE